MLTSVLCACNNGENQSDTSQSDNSANLSQQTVTTEAMATQPATEPNYENTNYVAPIPQKNQKYKFEEISLDEAVTSSGYSMSDSKFRITDAYMLGEYLVVSITYSNINSTAFVHTMLYLIWKVIWLPIFLISHLMRDMEKRTNMWNIR